MATSDYFSLYDFFTIDEKIPFFEIQNRNSDKYENWKEGVSTYDSLSYKYYGTSMMGWILQYGNPIYPDQFKIDDGVIIRIPFPLTEVKKEILDKIDLYNTL